MWVKVPRLAAIAEGHWRAWAVGKTVSSLKSRRSSIAELSVDTVIAVTASASVQTVTAPQPPKLFPKSLLGTSVWTHFLIEKFHLQRPMHRTLKNLQLLGLDLATGTVTDGLRQIAPLMTPIYEAIQTRQARSKYLHADETRWKVFTEKAGKKGYNWWLWVFARNDAVNFVLDPSRSHKVPQSRRLVQQERKRFKDRGPI